LNSPRSATAAPGKTPFGKFITHPGPELAHLAQALLNDLHHWAPVAAPVLAAAVIAVTGGRAWLLRYRHARLACDARLVTVLPPPEVDPDGGQALWSNLTGLLRPPWQRLRDGQPHLAYEYAWSPAGVRISLWVPGTIPPGLIERAAEAAWPGARTQVAPAAAPIASGSQVEAGKLRLSRPDHYPLRTGHDADPLRALLGAGAVVADTESALVQVLARPVTGRRLLLARRAAAQLRGGRPVRLAGRLLDLLTPGPAAPARPQAASQAFPERAAEIRAILDKAAHPRWAVAIRYAVATTSDVTSDPAARQRLRGRAHALASAYALYTGHNQLVRRRLRHPASALAIRRLGRGQLLSVPELAALAHLPLDPAVPGLARAGARAVVPPPGIPRPGPDTKPLGETDAGIMRAVALRVADARHHLHVLGATGAGKSTLIANMVLADVAAGRGTIVIDPKGDLITDLLPRLPDRVASKTVLFDPNDAGPQPALNVLDGPDADLTVDHLVGIFHRIFDKFWGPRTDDVLRSACLTLAAKPGATLADIPRLLGETAYRASVTATVHDPILRGFWNWYDELSDAHRSYVTGPVMNKLRAFLLRRFVRATVGARASSFDMGAVLDGGLCLVRVPKGVLGEETSRLLGSFVLARAWQTATHRARAGQADRKDAALYIDECQNFLTLPHGLEDMLAEARAYRISLVLVHQNLAQLSRELREAISANARSKIMFTVSPEDAAGLQRHVAPNLSGHDLAHLGAYQAAARLVVAGAEAPAFTLRTRPLPPPVPGRAEHIRAAARAAHGARPGNTRKTRTSRPADPRQRPAASASRRNP
jgi:hypothetical protein